MLIDVTWYNAIGKRTHLADVDEKNPSWMDLLRLCKTCIAQGKHNDADTDASLVEDEIVTLALEFYDKFHRKKSKGETATKTYQLASLSRVHQTWDDGTHPRRSRRLCQPKLHWRGPHKKPNMDATVSQGWHVSKTSHTHVKPSWISKALQLIHSNLNEVQQENDSKSPISVKWRNHVEAWLHDRLSPLVGWVWIVWAQFKFQILNLVFSLVDCCSQLTQTELI